MNSTELPSYDVIVVGSGPGGATVAREMARRGARVLILEQGGAAPLRGTLGQMASMAAVPGRGAYFNQDGSLLVSAVAAGGSSAINYATALAPPLPMFDRYGIDLRAGAGGIAPGSADAAPAGRPGRADGDAHHGRGAGPGPRLAQARQDDLR